MNTQKSWNEITLRAVDKYCEQEGISPLELIDHHNAKWNENSIALLLFAICFPSSLYIVGHFFGIIAGMAYGVGFLECLVLGILYFKPRK